jgi:cell division protein FtsL
MSKVHSSTLGTGGWFLILIVAILFSFPLSVYSMWIRFDTQEVAYDIQRLQREADEAKMHISKLETEKDSLLSPYSLGKTAEKLGMSMADPGQIRRLQSFNNR